MDTREIQPSEDDLRIAAEVIARWPDAPKAGTPEYDAKVRALAQFRAVTDHDSFDLRFGRREPVCGAERLRIRADRETWDEQRLAMEFQAFAERPVDEEMIEDAHADLKRRIEAYGRLLVRVVDAATDQRDPGRGEREEDEIAALWGGVLFTCPMFTTELERLGEFLIDVRASAGQAVTCMNVTEPSARLLVWRVLSDAHEMWKRVSEIAERSRTRPEYTRRASPVELFYGSVVADKGRPKPMDLLANIEIERRMALDYLEGARKQGLPEDGGSWVPAWRLGKRLADRVRAAAQPDRKTKRVRSKMVGGVKMYSEEDIRQFWPGEIPEQPTA